ncbi:hypothetical protein DID78_05970 [Candidatus Marinamargulisbacteria bacterium SCGC AG-343-D04]|nr:hypothetical protein DID78_05970 [Candidatus Marinamargulisbacteria bacterium SCGC AG-343-D04]
MKNNLQKRILLPFIIFTLVLTTLLITWSSIFISKIFTEKESENFALNLQYIDKHFAEIIHSSTVYLDAIKTEKDLQKQRRYLSKSLSISDFTVNYDTSIINQLSNKSISIIPKNTKNSPQLLLSRALNQQKPASIHYNLSKELSKMELDPLFKYGLIFFNDKKNTHQNNPLIILTKQTEKETLSPSIRKAFLNAHQNNTFTHNLIIKKPLKLSFKQSNQNPHLYYFIATSSSAYIATFIKIILGVISVVTVFTSLLFFIYNLIIKKMTTSIDIMRTVSKKVAQGDFTQKVFIESNDEISELATSFNQMVEKLKKSSDILLHQKEQSEAIIACLPDGIIVTDLSNTIILANTQAENIFDFTIKEKINTPLETFITNKTFKEHLISVKTNTVYTSEFSHTTDKMQKTFLMTSTVVKNIRKKPIGIVYLIRDITHEKQIEELREGFLRTVSHELRTPLTSVIGFIELVTHTGKDTLTEEQHSCLSTALKEASTLKVLINDLLELSQIQANKTKLAYKKISIHEFINTITHSLTPLTKGKDLTLNNNVTDQTLYIDADEAKLRRVFVNLISNSIKFTEKGFINVSCKELPDAIEFSVQDSGIGLKESEKDVIFEKFRQIDYSSTREYDGIGLGLSIVKELVELHNGNIRVESTLKKGSTFIFTIEKKRSLTAAPVS